VLLSVTMYAEQIGTAELDALEQQNVILRRILEASRDGENTSVACARILASIQSEAANDGFVVTAGGEGIQAPTFNQYHSVAPGTAASDGGCCIVI
jgi:hypothetical protein